MSLGVGDSMRVFSWWNWHTSKGDAIVELVGLLSFKSCSLITSSSETYCCWPTYYFWLIGDRGFSRVVVLSEGTSNKRNHFLNKIFRISLEYQLFSLVLLKIGLVVAFFWRFIQWVNPTNNWVNIIKHHLTSCPLSARSKVIAIMLLKYTNHSLW